MSKEDKTNKRKQLLLTKTAKRCPDCMIPYYPHKATLPTPLPKTHLSPREKNIPPGNTESMQVTL